MISGNHFQCTEIIIISETAVNQLIARKSFFLLTSQFFPKVVQEGG
jgi:hypothetical protein